MVLKLLLLTKFLYSPPDGTHLELGACHWCDAMDQEGGAKPICQSVQLCQILL